MNVLVTGGTGFLGSHLIPKLLKRGFIVSALARSDSSEKALRTLGATPVAADLCDGETLRKALGQFQIDAVFHLAAEIASQRSKEKLRAVNIEGTRNLYEAVKDRGELRKFIFASTVVTGEANGRLLVESTPLFVETEYGRTKQAAEKILLDAFHAHHFPAVIFRPCHIYGPGGWFGQVLEDMKKGKMRVPGNGKNEWDMVHVDDCARGLLAVLDHGQPGEIYHCADDTPVTMGEVVAEAARLMNVRKPGNAPRFLANLVYGRDTITSVVRSARTSNKKLRSLGWEPKYPDNRSGLKATVAEMNV